MDEATPLDTPSELLAGYGDAINLFNVIDRDKPVVVSYIKKPIWPTRLFLHHPHRVNGLNLTVPEDAKELIKSWDQRESTEKYVDSGVDDQVSHLLKRIFIVLTYKCS